VENEPELTVVNDERRGRYQVKQGDRPIAFSEYELEPGRIVFTHTVVRPEYEGKGIGSRLARFAIQDAQARGLRITPVCPFVRSYLRRHPEYEPIVDYPVSSR
jgi:predicted GNAT family acetyltransferase